MPEMGAGSVARYGDAVFIKHLDGSWYKATYNPGGIGHSDETLSSFGEILYKVSPLEGLEAGAIIKAVDNDSLVAVKSNGLWFITAEARSGFSDDETADYFVRHGGGYTVVRSGNE